MKLSDLITNPKSRRISSVKLASTTTYLVGTFWFCWHNYHSGFNEAMWWVYFGVVATHKTAEKLIATRFSTKQPSDAG